MGIKGLTNFVDVTFQKWKGVEIKDCPIVIDGSSLPYHLQSDFDWKFGGQYSAISDAIENFFETLFARGINPIHVVFDGASPLEKKNALVVRRQAFQDTVRKSLARNDATYSDPDERNIRSPLTTETLRKVMLKYKDRIKIYPADEDLAQVAVSLARHYGCYLVGQSSDFFVYRLPKGYIPLAKLQWSRPGYAVRGKVFRRDVFMKSLDLDQEFMYVIPAIAGNDTLPNLLQECPPLKDAIREDKDSKKGIRLLIDFLQRKCSNMDKLLDFFENDVEDEDDKEPGYIMQQFLKNLTEAEKKYNGVPPFNEDNFRKAIAHQSIHGQEVPLWIVHQYKDFMFSSNLLEVFVHGNNFMRVIPDDCSKYTSMRFSRSVRKEIYRIMFGKDKGVTVTEVIRQAHSLLGNAVTLADSPQPTKTGSAKSKSRLLSTLAKSDDTRQKVIHNLTDFKIDGIFYEPKETRHQAICKILQCNGETLTIDEEWHLTVSSLVFWVKNAKIQQEDIRLKALVLCFVECFHKSPASEYSPVFSLEALHLYAQWQCVYHDAILLNQVLALPLPYLSPADLFDGKRVTYYSQKSDKEFDAILRQTRDETKKLYTRILEIVYRNML